jgi:hypothetical protein
MDLLVQITLPAPEPVSVQVSLAPQIVKIEAVSRIIPGAPGPAGATGPAGPAVSVDSSVQPGSANAVSGGAVHDALALKASLDHPVFQNCTIGSGGAGIFHVNCDLLIPYQISCQRLFAAGDISSNGGVTGTEFFSSGPINADGRISGSNLKNGYGSPEGVVYGNPGDTYSRADGGPGTTWYVKEAGGDQFGWAAK